MSTSLMLNPGPVHVQTVLEHLVAHSVIFLGLIQAHSRHHDSSGGFVGDRMHSASFETTSNMEA